MLVEHPIINVPPDSELGLTLKAAQTRGDSIVVDTGEERYTLLVVLKESPRDIFAHYDPQAAIAGLRALDDAFAGVDREGLLRDLHMQRAQESSGRSD